MSSTLGPRVIRYFISAAPALTLSPHREAIAGDAEPVDAADHPEAATPETEQVSGDEAVDAVDEPVADDSASDDEEKES